MTKTFIIAEAGVNHNGSLDLALRLVDEAAAAGADAVKFQTFRAEEIVTPQAAKAAYQKRSTGDGQTQLEMIKALELSPRAHETVAAHCRAKGIRFLSTPFDALSADRLAAMGMAVIKIPSGEITNLPYLRHLGGMGLPLIVSTGMSTLDEVRAAVAVLEQAGTPRSDLTLLHCNTQYPTPYEDANLRAMLALAEAFPGAAVGYSDHTPGIECALAAVALGAAVVEKHFTLDRAMPGPDHLASLEPGELTAMVRGIRNVEAALGSGRKEPTPSERENMAVARRVLVAVRPIAAGEAFSGENIAARRAGAAGVSPMLWDQVLGRPAPRAFEPGERIEL